MSEYPENQAIVTWKANDLTFTVTSCRGMHYCGYARFSQKPVEESSYHGILTYVPVHGGITYAEQSNDGSMVYGFDCGHYGDESNPDCSDLDWLKAECEIMAEAIKIAAKYEQRYLQTAEQERAEVLQEYYDETEAKFERGFNPTNNFGIRINILAGNL